MENIFRSESYEKLYKLYNDIIGSKEDGLRPKSLDKYIAEIQVTYPLTTGEAWRYTENLFREEIGRRYFEEREAK